MSWADIRLKYLCIDSGQYGLNVPADQYSAAGTRLIRTSDISEMGTLKPEGDGVYVDQAVEERHRLQEGDLLLSRSGTLGRSFLVPNDGSGATYAGFLVKFRPRPDVEPRFLSYASMSSHFQDTIRSEAVSSTIQNFNAERYANISLMAPGLEEQCRIADFLDAETDHLNRLVRLRQRQKLLLTERTRSEIAKLATIGDGCEICETGNVWIPRIAAGWTLEPLKRWWRIVDCKHRTPEYVDEGYPVVSPGDITPGRLNLSAAHRFVTEEDFADLADDMRRPMRGDIVYSRNASIGIAAYVDTEEPFTMGQDVCRITSNSQDQLFLAHFLNSAGLAELNAMQIGSTFTRVNIATLLELSIARPPVEEQRKLSRLMDERVESAERIMRILDRQLTLLIERSQALITAAVTGQFDVSTACGGESR